MVDPLFKAWVCHCLFCNLLIFRVLYFVRWQAVSGFSAVSKLAEAWAGLLIFFWFVFYWADGEAISPALIHINNAFVDLTC